MGASYNENFESMTLVGTCGYTLVYTTTMAQNCYARVVKEAR